MRAKANIRGHAVNLRGICYIDSEDLAMQKPNKIDPAKYLELTSF